MQPNPSRNVTRLARVIEEVRPRVVGKMPSETVRTQSATSTVERRDAKRVGLPEIRGIRTRSAEVGLAVRSGAVHESAHLLPLDRLQNVAGPLEVEDQDWNVVLLAHGQGGHVHDLEVLFNGLGERE